jgi:putative spermidine/putrescine transport system substrate-binding protein
LSKGYDSNISRRDLLRQLGAWGGAAMLSAATACHRGPATGPELKLYGTATINPGDWSALTKATGIRIAFRDNGNDTGPVVTQMTTGTAAKDFDIGGLQGGAEPELASAGKILPWDTDQLKNWATVWDWAKAIQHTTYQGKRYGLPVVINADSMIYLPDKVGQIDTYAAVFDPKLKGKTSMEDSWINSAIFTAMFLKENSLQRIDDPGNLTPDELGAVMEFLIKHKRDGQFRKFWNGWEDGLNLVVSEEVWVMTGWEPIVYAAQKKGVKAVYAIPTEGYEGWSNDLILHIGAQDRNLVQAAHTFADWELSGAYACTLASKSGYVVPADSTSTYLTAHPGEYDGAEVSRIVENVKRKFLQMKGRSYWQNTRPTHYQQYEEWWSKLRAV